MGRLKGDMSDKNLNEHPVRDRILEETILEQYEDN